MKKCLISLICAVLSLLIFSSSVMAAPFSTQFDHTIMVDSVFSIRNNEAITQVNYDTIVDVEVTNVVISVTLQKRIALVFWDTIVEWTHYCYDSSDYVSFVYPVTSGQYRVKIHCDIFATDNKIDEVDFVHRATN